MLPLLLATLLPVAHADAPTLAVGEAIAGEPVSLVVTDAPPNVQAYIVWSPYAALATAHCFPARPDACTRLAAPTFVVHAGRTNAAGALTAAPTLPARAATGPFGTLEVWVPSAPVDPISAAAPLTIVMPDRDGDGHRADVDCDDTDARAYPGASGWHETPRNAGGFDFNCDGQESPYWIGYGGYCNGTNMGNGTYACWVEDGWWSVDIAACGVTDDWLDDCTGFTTQPSSAQCTTHVIQRTQKCR